MVDDILDKIVVPNGKSSKGDVFKKEHKHKEKEKPKESAKPKTKHHVYKKKEIFHKKEFRRPISFNIKTPGLIERGIFIAIILILFYFAFFQNMNINLDLGSVFGGNEIQPLVVKETETEETEVEEEIVEEVEEEPELTGEITFTVDDVKTEKYDTGVSKITGFTFTIDNQKEVFDATLKYYGYDGYTPAAWITKERGEEIYSIAIGTKSQSVDTSIVFTNTYTKTMRFELIDTTNDEIIANLTKEVTVS